MKTEHYAYLCNEFDFLASHKEKWSASPYPVSFNCADSFVICSGHILLIRRRNAPGKDLYALPGGYIGMNEQPVDAAIRELIEETRIKGPTHTQLKKNIVADKVFSHPDRSLRGRIYSHAYAINLGSGPLPKVKGSDDAIKAKWFTIDEVDNMRHLLFEDHADIISHFKGVIEK
jgi:bifunctional NMN adenylyltransferase/nudix hydrolase